LHGDARRIGLYVGIIGMLLMLMLVGLGLLLAPNSVDHDQQQGDDVQQAQPEKPSPPPKEPPLNR
jgi:hypothetical protein